MRRMPPVPGLRARAKATAPPQQARSVEKRRKLLEAGRVLFGQKGYEATSIEGITTRAGAAAGAFYQYFSSKQQFLIVLMNELMGRLNRLDLRPGGGTDPQMGLRQFLAAAFRVDVVYFGVVRAWQEAVLTDRKLSTMQQQIESWTQARVLGVFRQLQKLPNALPRRDLPTFARMMDRHFWSLLARGSRLTPREFNREVKVAADVIYHYLFCDSIRGGNRRGQPRRPS